MMDNIDSIGISTYGLHEGLTKILQSRDIDDTDGSEYLGVYAVDDIDDLISNCKTCIEKKKKFFWLVYNNRPSYDGGEHWRLLAFYRYHNKWYIYIYDSLGGESLVKSYPNIFKNIEAIKHQKELTNNYNNRYNNDIVNFSIKVDKNIVKHIRNKGSEEEKYFNDILRLIQKKDKKYKIKISTVLNRIQANNTPTCGLYCMLFVDIGVLPLYKKENKYIKKNIVTILKNHTLFFSKIFQNQDHINIIRLKEDIEKNEFNIRNIYGKYINHE